MTAGAQQHSWWGIPLARLAGGPAGTQPHGDTGACCPLLPHPSGPHCDPPPPWPPSSSGGPCSHISPPARAGAAPDPGTKPCQGTGPAEAPCRMGTPPPVPLSPRTPGLPPEPLPQSPPCSRRCRSARSPPSCPRPPGRGTHRGRAVPGRALSAWLRAGAPRSERAGRGGAAFKARGRGEALGGRGHLPQRLPIG